MSNSAESRGKSASINSVRRETKPRFDLSFYTFSTGCDRSAFQMKNILIVQG